MAASGTEEVGWGEVLAEFAGLLAILGMAVVWLRRWQGDWPQREDERRSRGWLRFLKGANEDYAEQARYVARSNLVICVLVALGFSGLLGWTVLRVI